MFQYELLYYLKKYKKTILLWTGVSILLVGIISFAIWQQNLEERRGKLPIPIKTVPVDATVRIGDVTYQQGTQYIAPGSYIATISKAGFHTVKQKIRINQQLPTALYVGLAPANDETERWQKRHARDYAEIERLGFALSQEYGKEFQKRWPIVESLPIKDPYFTISYKNTPGDDLLVTIQGTSARYRELALDHLRTKGFDPTDYRIEFIGFKNPLKEGQ